jgi:hypothetical protein
MSLKTEGIDWSNPSHMPLSNGPIRTVTGPAQPTYALDSERSEMEYLLPFPFHAIDSNPWLPISFISKGVPITVYRPIGTTARHSTTIQMGNEEADAYCTVIRVSRPTSFELSSDDGWLTVRRLLEWIRVKCRHYWLLHGINGFGAAYRGTMFSREGNTITQQNLAMYGPNVIVNPLTVGIWSTLAAELQEGVEVPIEDSLYCDALLSIAAGDSVKALLEAGVAMEVALTKLLVDVSTSLPLTPAKKRFIEKEGDRHPFGKKLIEWTKILGLESIESFAGHGNAPNWHLAVRDLYRLRNGVAHAGMNRAVNWSDVVQKMYAAGALLEYCRAQRIQLGLSVFSMPPGIRPVDQIRYCHNAHISTTSQKLVAVLR